MPKTHYQTLQQGFDGAGKGSAHVLSVPHERRSGRSRQCYCASYFARAHDIQPLLYSVPGHIEHIHGDIGVATYKVIQTNCLTTPVVFVTPCCAPYLGSGPSSFVHPIVGGWVHTISDYLQNFSGQIRPILAQSLTVLGHCANMWWRIYCSWSEHQTRFFARHTDICHPNAPHGWGGSQQLRRERHSERAGKPLPDRAKGQYSLFPVLC